MGIMTAKSKPQDQAMKASGSGCFTVDRDGRVISSTLAQTFPPEMTRRIGRTVLAAFQSAHEAQLIFNEIQVTFPAIKLTARELRGGAIIFLAPSKPVLGGSTNHTSAL
jgi:hypothetical protein